MLYDIMWLDEISERLPYQEMPVQLGMMGASPGTCSSWLFTTGLVGVYGTFLLDTSVWKVTCPRTMRKPKQSACLGFFLGGPSICRTKTRPPSTNQVPLAVGGFGSAAQSRAIRVAIAKDRHLGSPGHWDLASICPSLSNKFSIETLERTLKGHF